MLTEKRLARTRIFEYPALPDSRSDTPSPAPRRDGGGLDQHVLTPSSEWRRDSDRLLLEQQPDADLQAEIDRLSTARLNQEANAQKTRHHAELEEARERGRLLGYEAARAEGEKSVQQRRDRLESLLSELDRRTQNYLVGVEREVITLALDIAARILQHEAQIDPLFLAGAVRVALEAMREKGEIQVRVPLEDLAGWAALLQGVHFVNKKLLLEGDATMRAGQCICRPVSGILDLGVNSQLAEVERSFEQVLRRREAQTSNEHPNKEEPNKDQASPGGRISPPDNSAALSAETRSESAPAAAEAPGD